MAIDFPAAPTDGQEFPAGGITYVWNGTGWTVKPVTGGGATGDFVLKTGDTMSGALLIDMPVPWIGFGDIGGTIGAGLWSYRGSASAAAPITSWGLNLGSDATHSKFTIERYDDTGVFLGHPLAIDRATGWTTVTDLTVAEAWPTFRLAKSAGGAAQILGSLNGISRWIMRLGDHAAESVANTGSDFTISRCNDAGTESVTLIIDRATGLGTVAGDPVAPLGIATKQYVDANSGGGGGAYLPLTGGTLTGALIINTVNYSNMYYGLNGINRWEVRGTEPSGVCPFEIHRMDATGTFASTPLSINNATGDINIAHYLTVGGHVTTGYDVIAGRSISAAGTLTITGAATFHSPVACGQTLNVGGRADFANLITVGSVLYAYGGIECSGLLHAITDSRTEGATYGVGAATFYSTVQIVSTLTCGYINSQGGAVCYFSGGFTVTNGSNYWNTSGDLVITNTAWKPGGGDWANSSDARIKTVLGDYTTGLAAIKQLNPKRYQYKGNDVVVLGSGITPPPDIPELEPFTEGQPNPRSPNYQVAIDTKTFIGLVAQDCEVAMPELITLTAGEIDGAPVTDYRLLDSSALTYALINAVKELSAQNEALTARVAALEGTP